jgi:O-antigen ligase
LSARTHILKRELQTPLFGAVGEWLFALFLFAGYYKADHRLAFIQSHIDITLLFLALSFAVFLYRWLRNEFAHKIPRDFIIVAALFLLLEACLLGGLLHTQSTEYGSDKVMRFIFLTGWAFFGATFLITDFSSLKRFSWAFVVISAVMASDALSNYPGLGQVSFTTAFGSNYIALARAGGLGLLAIAGFLIPVGQRPSVKICLGVMAVLQLGAALSAGARGPVISLVLSSLLFFLLSVRGFPPVRMDRFVWRLAIMACFIAVVLAITAQDLFPTLIFRTHLALARVDTSVETRLALYRAAIELWATSPLWGIGVGEFGVALVEEDIRLYPHLYPHNIILELGAETGLLSALIFLTMIGLAFYKGFICLLCSQSGLSKIVARYLIVVGCFALLNSMVSGDINDNRVLFTLVALLTATDRFWKHELKGG